MCSLIGFSNLTFFFEVKVEGVTAVAYQRFIVRIFKLS